MAENDYIFLQSLFCVGGGGGGGGGGAGGGVGGTYESSL